MRPCQKWITEKIGIFMFEHTKISSFECEEETLYEWVAFNLRKGPRDFIYSNVSKIKSNTWYNLRK